jgi:tetratricopeptide (TPR) repeat protein
MANRRSFKFPAVFCVFLVAAGGIALTLKWHYSSNLVNLPDPACAQRPTVDCLADAAAALAAHTDNDLWLAVVSENLARAGHFAQAERSLSRVTDPQRRQMVDQVTAVNKISWAPRNDPDKATDLSPIEQLTPKPGDTVPVLVEQVTAYYLLTLNLLGRHPFDSGQSDVVAVEKGAWRRPVPLASSTLDQIVERWEARIPDLPTQFRAMAWTNLADTLIDLDRPGEAKEALEAAMSATNTKFINAIARQWIRLGDADRAFQLLNASDKPYASAYLDIAEVILRRGDNSSSISSALDKAFTYAGLALSGAPDFELERRIIAFEKKIGDSVESQRMKVAIMQQARQPALFQPGNLATAAAVSLDLGDHETARALLKEAKRAFPKDERAVIAVGMVAGPMSYSTWHIGDRMRTAIAIQYYRLGDSAEFDELFGKISTDFRFETWQQLFDENLPPGVPQPPLARVEPAQRAALMALLAAQQAKRGDVEKAKALLNELLRIDANDLGALMNGARLALALDHPGLAQKFFLRQVAIIAADNGDAGIKAFRLSGAAAFLAESFNKSSP